MKARHFIALALISVLTACSGGVGGPTPRVPDSTTNKVTQPAQSAAARLRMRQSVQTHNIQNMLAHLQKAVPAEPLDPSRPGRVVTFANPPAASDMLSQHALLVKNLAERESAAPKSVRTPMNTAGSDNGGAAGMTLLNVGNYGIYSNTTVWIGNYSNLDTEQTWGNVWRSEDSSCLEPEIFYFYPQKNGTVDATYTDIGVLDLCQGSGGTYHPIWDPVSSSFSSSYIRDLGDGLPEITTEVAKNSNGTWTFYVYNYSSQAWESHYTSTGTTGPDAGGEDEVVFNLPQGQGCPLSGTLSSTGVREDRISGWNLVYSDGDGFMDPTTVNSGTCMGPYDGTSNLHYFNFRWICANDCQSGPYKAAPPDMHQFQVLDPSATPPPPECSNVGGVCAFQETWPASDSPSCVYGEGITNGYTGTGRFIVSPTGYGTLTQDDANGIAQFTRSAAGAVTITAEAQYETFAYQNRACVAHFTYNTLETWDI